MVDEVVPIGVVVVPVPVAVTGAFGGHYTSSTRPRSRTLPWSLPRARSMPLRAAPRTHRKRRLAPRPCGGNSRLACAVEDHEGRVARHQTRLSSAVHPRQSSANRGGPAPWLEMGAIGGRPLHVRLQSSSPRSTICRIGALIFLPSSPVCACGGLPQPRSSRMLAGLHA